MHFGLMKTAWGLILVGGSNTNTRQAQPMSWLIPYPIPSFSFLLAHDHRESVSPSSMTSTLTSLSSVLGQTHCGLRLKKLHSKCRLSFSFLCPPNLQASVVSCYHRRSVLPLKMTFPFDPCSRSFSQTSICFPEGTILRHFIAQAALTASSEAQLE